MSDPGVETSRTNAVALVSIGAATSIPHVIAAYVEHARKRQHHLTVIPLDTLEGINGLILRNDSEASAAEFIGSKLQEVRAVCEQLGPDVQCRPYSEYTEDAKLSAYDTALRDANANHSSFRRAIANQTFHNLYPILKRLGIDKRDTRLRSLSKFLLQEISLKCYLGNEKIAAYEYGHAPMMQVLEDIYRHKYPALASIVAHRLFYDEVLL